VREKPTLSVSLAAYDGHEPATALESLARLGVRHVEPSYRVAGEPFDGSAFTTAQARRWAGWLKATGMHCHTVFAEVDLLAADTTTPLQRRLEFLAELGGTRLILPAPQSHDTRRALKHLLALSGHVEATGVQMALSPSLDAGVLGLPQAADLVAAAQLPWLGLDFRTEQAALAQPGLSVADQLEAVSTDCVHVHLCDVRPQDGWFPVPLGEGCVEGDRVLRHLAQQPQPITLDLPLRLHRSRTGLLLRAPYRVPLADIEQAVKRSVAFVNHHLSSRFFH